MISERAKMQHKGKRDFFLDYGTLHLRLASKFNSRNQNSRNLIGLRRMEHCFTRFQMEQYRYNYANAALFHNGINLNRGLPQFRA